MTQRSVLNWMTVGLIGLVGCQQAPAYAEPTGASGAIEFCGHCTVITGSLRIRYNYNS